MPVLLRDYQIHTIRAIQAMWERGYHSTIANLFTGAGKTIIFIEYLKHAIDVTQERALVMTPAHLIYQTRQKFFEQNVGLSVDVVANGYSVKPRFGVVMADYDNPDARIIIGSVPTLIDRVPEDQEPIKRSDLEVEELNGKIISIKPSATCNRKVLISERVDAILKHGMIDQMIYDEAHHAVSPGGYTIITRLWQICEALDLPKTKLIGFTATAFREDGLGLHNLFQNICIQRSFRWGIENGYLAPLVDPPLRVRADLGGNRNEKILRTDNWAETIISAWQQAAADRPSLFYLPSVEDSVQLTRYAQEQGMAVAHIDSERCIDSNGAIYDKDYREEIFKSFMEGRIRGISNYSVILEGTDLPPASCMVWARPTDNAVLVTQAVGRILRLFDGNQYLPKKENALIIDVVAKDLPILSAGTVAGFKVQDNGVYVKDEDEENTVEEELYDGLDIRDSLRGSTIANGVIFSIGRLVRKNEGDWYHDESNDILSLSVSTNRALVITSPFYSTAEHMKQVLRNLMPEIEANPDDEKLADRYSNIRRAADMFENYTLWDVHVGKPTLDWVFQDITLGLIMDYAIVHANEVADPITSFMYKKKSWKDALATDKQYNKMREINLAIPSTNLKKGEAAQLITHHLAFTQNVRLSIARIYKSALDSA